jgi:hypothetical protein
VEVLVHQARRLAAFSILGVLWISCGKPPRKAEELSPPARPPAGTLANPATQALFARLARKEVGDATGKIEFRDQGILIHPGEKTPTTAVFRLDGELKQIDVRLFIAPLGPEGSKVPDAGTVNVEVLLDGKSVLKKYVDRDRVVQETLQVSGVKEMAVRVDNANGKPWWDWFMFSVTALR